MGMIARRESVAVHAGPQVSFILTGIRLVDNLVFPYRGHDPEGIQILGIDRRRIALQQLETGRLSHYDRAFLSSSKCCHAGQIVNAFKAVMTSTR